MLHQDDRKWINYFTVNITSIKENFFKFSMLKENGAKNGIEKNCHKSSAAASFQ
jgi:hypothetical protein